MKREKKLPPSKYFSKINRIVIGLLVILLVAFGVVGITSKIGGDLVKDYYSKDLFSYVAAELSKVNYTADDDLTDDEHFGALTSRVIDQSWWDKFIGSSGDVTESTYKGIYAVQKVTTSDVSVTSTEAAKNLYINENDFSDLKDDVTAANKNGQTVYLFRYQITDYFAQEATLFKRTDKNAWINDDYYWEEIDTNAYFFYETVNLDFEIIDVTFKKDEVKTVIPVVMSPIDVIPASEPPIETNPDEDGGCTSFSAGKFKKFLIVLLVVAAGILAIKIIAGILKTQKNKVKVTITDSGGKTKKRKRRKKRKKKKTRSSTKK